MTINSKKQITAEETHPCILLMFAILFENCFQLACFIASVYTRLADQADPT